MFTIDDIAQEVRRRFTPGSAVVDLKFNEVFRFSMEQDCKVVHEYPAMFRAATADEESKLKASGQNSITL